MSGPYDPHTRRKRSFKMTRGYTLLNRWTYSGVVSVYWGRYIRSITLFIPVYDLRVRSERDLTLHIRVRG